MDPVEIGASGTPIIARSERQAMDWSLVLASQGIETVISSPANGGWHLLVSPAEYERALASIRQYRLENRGWAWRQELPGGELEIHSGAVFWCLLLAFWHWAASFLDPQIFARGRMDSVLVPAGEWWRLFTPVVLHSDLAHLMANVTFGLLMLGLAMARFGPGIALLATFLAGAFGNLFGLMLYQEQYTGVGASGMMMAALGLLCVHSAGLWRKSPKAAKYVLSGVFAGMCIFVLFGLSPGSDILAHLGGFIGGLLAGLCLAFAPQALLQRRSWNNLALALLALIFGVTWYLALR